MALDVFGYTVTELNATQGPDFEAVREKTAPVCGAVTRDPAELLARARLACQKGGRPRAALDCLGCSRFVNFVPSLDRSFVTIRCASLSSDPVENVMTLARAVVTVDPGTPVIVADEFARTRGVRHLVVEAGSCFVGIVCRCDFIGAEPDTPVADHMARQVLVVDSRTSLGAAAALMATFGVGCLPVLDGDRLCGVVTRGDLRRAGVEEEQLGAGTCDRCGSRHGVCSDPCSLEAPELCLDCHRVAA